MEDLKLLLLIVLPFVALASIGGIVYGKHQLKKATGQLRPLLTPKQRIFYTVSIAVGIVCLLVGFLYNPVPSTEMGEDIYEDMGMMEDNFTVADSDKGVENYPDAATSDIVDSINAKTGSDEAEDIIAPESEDDASAEEGDLPEGEVLDSDTEAVTDEEEDKNSSDGGATVQAAPAPTVRRGSVRIGGRSGGNVVIMR